MRNLLILFLLVSCQKPNPTPEPEPVTPDVAALRADAVARMPEFLDMNYVVSRNQDGSAEHKGDSLLFTSLLVSAAKCDEFQSVEQTLQRAIFMGDGQLRRHYELDDASVDGAIGLFRAVAQRYKLGCQSLATWREPLELLKAYAEANNGAINHNSAAGLDAHGYVLDLLLDRLAGNSSPGYRSDDRDLLAELMASWSLGVQATYELWKAGVGSSPAAAYRVHLGLLTFETLEALGVDVAPSARDRFCQSSVQFDMPTVDYWCGRRPIADWVESFQYDQWEYRHQRAGAWETPDGNGYRTPAVDLLKAISDGYVL